MVEIFCGVLFCGIMFMLIYSAFIKDLKNELNYCIDKANKIIELQQLNISTIERLINIHELNKNTNN